MPNHETVNRFKSICTKQFLKQFVDLSILKSIILNFIKLIKYLKYL